MNPGPDHGVKPMVVPALWPSKIARYLLRQKWNDGGNGLVKLSDQNVAAADSSISMLGVHAQADWAIARQCWDLKRAGPSGPAAVETVGSAWAWYANLAF
jgi:hypothetical protein